MKCYVRFRNFRSGRRKGLTWNSIVSVPDHCLFLYIFSRKSYEPRHDKTNTVSVRPAKTQISLGICPVWSVFAVRKKKDSVLSYPLIAQRRLWSDWADAKADLSLRWAHTHFVGFVMRRLICNFRSRHEQGHHNSTCSLWWPSSVQQFNTSSKVSILILRICSYCCCTPLLIIRHSFDVIRNLRLCRFRMQTCQNMWCFTGLIHVMRKPVYAICEQQRRRSACASAQSDQHLCCSLPRWYITSSFYIRNFKPQPKFCGCAGRFESSLVANPEDRFFRDEAHFMVSECCCTCTLVCNKAGRI